jgi:ferredoxin like protein
MAVKMDEMATVLFGNTYHVDSAQTHIRIKEMSICHECAERPCVVSCPAAVYVWEFERLTVQYSGCLECGACRIVCPHDNIDWRLPRAGYGVTAG